MHEGLSPDPLNVQKMFDIPQCGDKRQLQVFVAIVDDLSESIPSLVSTTALLPDLHGASRTGRWSDTQFEVFNTCQN